MPEGIHRKRQQDGPSLDRQIVELLSRADYTPLNISELSARLGIQRNRRRELEQTIARMERAGEIARIKHGERFGLPLVADLIPGRIRMNRQGVGRLQPND